MANDPRLTNAMASAAADAVVDFIDVSGPGTIKIYAATIPANADAAVGGATLLATLTFPATAFGAASNGVATAGTIVDDSSADATATATWARWENGTPATVLDCTVGASGADINFNTDAFVAGAVISITSLTYTQPLT